MIKQTIITALLALVAIAGQGQTTFDTGEGCLTKGFRLLPILKSILFVKIRKKEAKRFPLLGICL